MNKTINEIYVDYLKYLALKNKITTIKGINYRFKKYILPFFGNMKINEIKIQHYIDFQLYLKKLNYSPSFYESTHIIVKKFFDYIKFLYGIDNVAEKVGYQKSNTFYSTTQKKGTFSAKEFNKFIKSVDDKIYHALFNTLFYCGLRKGEALALKISDFDGKNLIINKTLTKEQFNGKRQLLTPKTEKSNRIIQLDLKTKLELKQLIKYYSKKFDNFNNNFFLFGADKPIATTTLERKKNYYCKKANVKQIRIHDFRHSHATMLYNKNVKIKLIQERLGHDNIDTTLNTYVHTNKIQEKRLIKTINLIRL